MDKPKKCRRRSIRNLRRVSTGFHSPPLPSAPYGSAWIDHDLETNMDNMVLSESQLQHDDGNGDSAVQKHQDMPENLLAFMSPPAEYTQACESSPETYPATWIPKEQSETDQVALHSTKSFNSFSLSPDMPLWMNSIEGEGSLNDGDAEATFPPHLLSNRPFLSVNQQGEFDLSFPDTINEASIRDKDDESNFEPNDPIDVLALEQAYKDLSLNFSPVPEQEQTIDYLVRSLGFDFSFSPEEVQHHTPECSAPLPVYPSVTSTSKSHSDPKPALQPNEEMLQSSRLYFPDATFTIDPDPDGEGNLLVGKDSCNVSISDTRYDSSLREFSSYLDKRCFGDSKKNTSESRPEAGDFIRFENENVRSDVRMPSGNVDHFVSFVSGVGSELERIRSKEIAEARSKEIAETISKETDETISKEIGETRSTDICTIGSKEIDETGSKEIGYIRSKEIAEDRSKEIAETISKKTDETISKEIGETRSTDICTIGSKEIDETGSKEIGYIRSNGIVDYAHNPVNVNLTTYDDFALDRNNSIDSEKSWEPNTENRNQTTTCDILAPQHSSSLFSDHSLVNDAELEQQKKRAKRRSSRKFNRQEFSAAFTQLNDESPLAVSVSSLPAVANTIPPLHSLGTLECDKENLVSGSYEDVLSVLHNGQNDERVRDQCALSKRMNKQNLPGKTKRGRKSGSFHKGKKSVLLEHNEADGMSKEAVVLERLEESGYAQGHDISGGHAGGGQIQTVELGRIADPSASSDNVEEEEDILVSRTTRSRRSRKSWGDVTSRRQAATVNQHKPTRSKTQSDPVTIPNNTKILEQIYLQKNYVPVKANNLETIKEVPANGVLFAKLKVKRLIKFPENLRPSVPKLKQRAKKIAKHFNGHNSFSPIDDEEFKAKLRDIELDLEMAD